MSFTIRELSSLSGVKPHTIRIWEQRYNFLKPSRTQTNIRTYSKDELKTLLTVALLNKYGYKISRIDQMPAAQREQLVLELPHAEAVNEALVNQMIGYMVDLRHREFELLIDTQVRSAGLDEALSGLIFQFLEKVGILWHTNRILPAQEHIVSNIIRQKVIRAIDELPYPEDSEPLFVLMLPDGEYHELGLLFVSYMLRKKGLSQIYLGSSVPMEDLFFLVKAARPHYVYLHLTSFTVHHHFSRFLQQLAKNAGTTKILLSGIVPQAYRKDLPSNATLFSTLRELRQFLDSQ